MGNVLVRIPVPIQVPETLLIIGRIDMDEAVASFRDVFPWFDTETAVEAIAEAIKLEDERRTAAKALGYETRFGIVLVAPDADSQDRSEEIRADIVNAVRNAQHESKRD